MTVALVETPVQYRYNFCAFKQLENNRMKKFIVCLLMGLMISSVADASKLSHWFNKQNQKQQQRKAEQRARDLNFADNAYRLQRGYVDHSNERCRVYDFRSHSNPYKHGTYTVCYGR